MAIANNPNDNPPLFNGQPIFGDLNTFDTQLLVKGRGLDVDNWLGLTPGTTKYGAAPSGGQLYGVTGAFIAPTAAAVELLQATLLSYAGQSGEYAYPTGLPWPGNWQFWANCYFVPAEYVPSVNGILPTIGNQYSLSYVLVVRRCP